MATARLVPSSYSLSSSTYLNIQNADNMYTNTDSDTYATITNTQTGTTTYYIYVRGFNFNSIPADAIINSFTVKFKARESGLSTSTSYRPYMVNNTTTITGSASTVGTTATTITFTGVTATWATIKRYGSDFGIRVSVRRSSRNTTGYLYFYGAEILVDYTVPNPRTITTTLSGNGTISPSGTTTKYDGDEFNLTITPTNKSDTVSITNNNVDVTNDLEPHYAGGTSSSSSKASESNVTTGFNRSGSNFYQSSSTASDSWLRYAIGHTAESPYSTTNTSNTYVKDGTNDADTMGWMNYPFDFSGLPLDAEVTAVEVKCYGAIEDASQTASHADIELYSGNELKSVRQSFTSTQNGTITINNPGTWTRNELQDAQVRFIVGYYGGRILGITWKVTYLSGGTLSHYTYSYTVNGDATIAVTIGGGQVVHVESVSVSPKTSSIQEGQTVQLTATVLPSNATDKSVIWSTNNSSVATVTNGLVSAISAGAATITVTTTDGGYTDTCAITVTAVPRTDYIQSNTMVPGKNYLIVNGNTGTVYMLSNEANGSRTLKGVQATVVNGKISLTAAEEAKCLFTCSLYTAGDSLTTCLSNNGQYLYCDNASGLRMYTSPNNKHWHYVGSANKFWLFRGTTNGYDDATTEYKYYLQYDSSGNFTDNHVTSPSIEDSTLPAIYLFRVDDGTTDTLYFKENGSYVEVIAAWKKINGTYVQQDITTVFQSGVNYRKGGN